MTEIKIPFTKKSIKNIPAKDLNEGRKGVELEVQTSFLMSQLCSNLDKAVPEPVQDAPFEKIAFVFKDGAEKDYYNSLLDSNKKDFELSFDKDKISLVVFGFSDVFDETKPEIQLNPNDKCLIVFLDSKFAGIIGLENKSGEEEKKPEEKKPEEKKPEEKKPEEKKPEEKKPDVSVVRNYCKSNDIKNLTYDEENDKLIIEYKQDKPNKEITDLSGELAEIKQYLLKKGKVNGKKRRLVEEDWEDKSQTQVQKTDYTPWLIGGGILLFVIVIFALVGMMKNNRD